MTLSKRIGLWCEKHSLDFPWTTSYFMNHYAKVKDADLQAMLDRIIELEKTKKEHEEALAHLEDQMSRSGLDNL